MSSLTPRQMAIQAIAHAEYQLNRVDFMKTHPKDIFGCNVSSAAVSAAALRSR